MQHGRPGDLAASIVGEASKQETENDGDGRSNEPYDHSAEEASEEDREVLPGCEPKEGFPANATEEVIVFLGGDDLVVVLVGLLFGRRFRAGGHGAREGVRNVALPTCKAYVQKSQHKVMDSTRLKT